LWQLEIRSPSTQQLLLNKDLLQIDATFSLLIAVEAVEADVPHIAQKKEFFSVVFSFFCSVTPCEYGCFRDKINFTFPLLR